ncbi:1-deoxy-D-xylulose-5-phosphate reductoisomerase [Candidatus Atribacteria bacterium RBG_19FT_COMBO_35_14]|uniref:1-deoxy-D-xylulose 5-phosphate reductoisomerase n=1 Tax=Candidatus Sediminicultor quintus TaxID=1797291 RepID=A0A1F5A7A2_9BACT|nr:MAG: 1-deoxy-D-xylulose-5-phosphate reductoisomerase [Candidatus Atribacteria bacterium RBG_19FT_COMBO_35_14]
MRKKVAILGSTGSIGQQTLEVIRKYSNEFEVVGLSGWENTASLKEQISLFRPKVAVVKNEYTVRKLKKDLDNSSDIKLLWGTEGLVKISTLEEADIIVVAITGIASLIPTFEAVKKGKKIALASKEAMVAAGELLVNEAKLRNAKILPIDSEHSAILQCLKNEQKDCIEKIILTASGGALYDFTETALKNVSIEDALNHPTWKMGKKVTIDSATLMNKGLEVIEAKWFFNIPVNKIEIVIHPQSYIHSMVQFIDGTILAQISEHDMKIPIQYALFYPNRTINNFSRLELTKIGQLTFKKPNFNKFPCIKLAYQALEIGGTMPAVLNGANEIAVNAFLDSQISFSAIPLIIQNTMKEHKPKYNPNISDILDADYWARERALGFCILE